MVETLEEIKKNRMIDNLLKDDMKEFLPYLEDKEVTDIAVCDSGELVVTYFGKGRRFTNIFIPTYITERIIKATSTINGKPLDSYSGFPILEGVIPKYNARITGLMPPNCCRAELQIRKPPENIYTLENYLESGKITNSQYKLIVNTVEQKQNIFVVGSTGAGKTTLTNAIIAKMVELFPNDNYYIIEDNPEIQCKARMKTMLWIDKRDAVKAVEEALRFSPDRIIFGEVRNDLVMRELIDAWRTHSGNITTFHATDCNSALKRIKFLLGADFSNSDISRELSDIISMIVHIHRSKDGIKIDEIMNLKNKK